MRLEKRRPPHQQILLQTIIKSAGWEIEPVGSFYIMHEPCFSCPDFAVGFDSGACIHQFFSVLISSCFFRRQTDMMQSRRKLKTEKIEIFKKCQIQLEFQWKKKFGKEGPLIGDRPKNPLPPHPISLKIASFS